MRNQQYPVMNQWSDILLVEDNSSDEKFAIRALRKNKSDERTKIVPVILLTSLKEDNDIIESYKPGAQSYIVKPVDFVNFEKAVSAII